MNYNVGCQEAWERQNGELVFKRYTVLVLQDEKSYGDGWWSA